MNEPIRITQEEQSDHLRVHVAGRLDGYWSAQLDDQLDKLLHAGRYHIALDMTELSYMSSLGIRILVKYRKAFSQAGGRFGIAGASVTVKGILEMAGIFAHLQWSGQAGPAPEEHKPVILEKAGFRFSAYRTPGAEALSCRFTGDPEKILSGGYDVHDCRTESFGRNRYGLGLGATGLGYDDCRERFGEFAALGDAVVYSPAGKPNSPDYMLKSGALIPRIEMLYGIIFEGMFGTTVSFSGEDQSKTISFSTLLETLQEITGHERFGMVMLAETTGLTGVSLNRSPVAAPEDQPSLFSFPAVRDNLNVTTEPEYRQMMSVAVGVMTKSGDPEADRFTRPVRPDSLFRQHFHAAVFQWQPLKEKDIDIDAVIAGFFEHDMIRGVLHLLPDTREMNGIGESEFRRGVCRIGALSSPVKTF